MNPVIFHIGFMKTGTSFLQGEVFPKLKEVNYIHYLHQMLVKDFGNDYPVLLSDGKLGGRAHSSRWVSTDNDCFSIASRIKEFFPEAKIILTVREHVSWLSSIYREYVRMGGCYRYERWYREVLNPLYKEPGFVERFCEHLSSVFGVDNVFVQHYEDLVDNPVLFLICLCRFIGCSYPNYVCFHVYNKGLNVVQLAFQRYLNLLFRSSFNCKGFIPWGVVNSNVLFGGEQTSKKSKGKGVVKGK